MEEKREQMYGEETGQIERRKKKRPQIIGRPKLRATGQKGGVGTVHFKGIGRAK